MARGGYRPGAGRPKGAKSRRPRNQLNLDILETLPEAIVNAGAEKIDPLAYMLKVMNDPREDPARRDRMAIAAAPFVHARKGEGQGKKEDKADRAKAAGSGKFAPSRPPLKIVK